MRGGKGANTGNRIRDFEAQKTFRIVNRNRKMSTKKICKGKDIPRVAPLHFHA